MKLCWRVDMSRVLLFVALILGFFILAVKVEGAPLPKMSCVAYQEPMVKCTSASVFEQRPSWRVYYWNDPSRVADFDLGVVVYLTLTEDFSVIEMRFQGNNGPVNVRAEGRWHDGKVQFRQYKDEAAPCNNPQNGGAPCGR